MPEPIDVILVTFNNEESIAACLDSVRNSLGAHLGMIHVVDNNSTDRTREILKDQEAKGRIHCHLEKENRGFAAGVNRSVDFSRAAYFFLLNPDAVVESSTLWDRLMDRLARDEQIAAIGLKVKNEEGKTQASAYRFPTIPRLILEASGMNELLKRILGERPLPQRAFPIDYVQGSAVLIKREAWNRIGGLDEKYFLYHEEMDWCSRAKQSGYAVWYDPSGSIRHHGGWRVPPGREFFYYSGLLRFFEKHNPRRRSTARAWILRMARFRLKRLRRKTDEESRLSCEGFEKLLSELQETAP